MQRMKIREWERFVLVAVMLLGSIIGSVSVFAESKSTNYQAENMQFGSDATPDSCSGTYCSHAFIGDSTSGRATNGVSVAQFGSVSPGDPSLDVIVDQGESFLGDLATETTAKKTMIVRVRTYLSSGYTMQIVGTPPKYEGHTIAAPSTPTNSQPGVEQFALNLVANTLPVVGANPVQVPSAETSFGTVRNDYAQPNKFMYKSGDTVASSATESGQTDYTVSMIVNISNGTPAGKYTGDYSAIVIPVY